MRLLISTEVKQVNGGDALIEKWEPLQVIGLLGCITGLMGAAAGAIAWWQNIPLPTGNTTSLINSILEGTALFSCLGTCFGMATYASYHYKFSVVNCG